MRILNYVCCKYALIYPTATFSSQDIVASLSKMDRTSFLEEQEAHYQTKVMTHLCAGHGMPRGDERQGSSCSLGRNNPTKCFMAAHSVSKVCITVVVIDCADFVSGCFLITKLEVFALFKLIKALTAVQTT